MPTYDLGGRFQRLVAIGRPLVIAHRGASGTHPENTLPAFLRAIELGSDIVELDSRLTKDAHVVVFHDASVERVTNGHGQVENLTSGADKGAGCWFFIHARRWQNLPIQRTGHHRAYARGGAYSTA